MLAGATILAALSIAVQVEPERLAPGEPLRVIVDGAGLAARPSGRFLGRPLTFLAAPNGPRWVAFAGADLTVEPGIRRLEVEAKGVDGRLRKRSIDLRVEPREYPTERLTVEHDYVEPPPELAERIGRETAALKALWKRSTPRTLFDGRVKRPLGGIDGRNFGRRRIFNGQPRSPHSGTDLSAPAGTPVGSAASGRVVLAEEHYFSGKLVVVDHGGGVYTIYAHLSSIDVAQGDLVKAGSPIGRVGDTGRVTGPHLHWGARVGGARVNPSSLLELLRF
ncbi:MAG: M23 family metallopeptidase [Acidobacteriota bacterium]